MQLNKNLKSKMPLIGAFGLLFGLASCGSYQYAGYEDDSIYGVSNRNVEYQKESVQESSTSQNSGYYQNYFKEKSILIDNLSQEDSVFTDIDSYKSNYTVENDTLNYPENYAGWGQNNNDPIINVYSSLGYGGYGYGGYGYGGYGYGGYGYGGYGYGGYYDPFYYGYGGYYGLGYGYPYYYGYGHGYYGYGHGYYGYGHGYYGYGYGGYGYGYGHSYYGGRGIAYNTGRRGAIYPNSYSSRLNRRDLTSTRNTTTYRPRRATNSNVRANTNTVTRPRSTTRRNINNTTRPRSTTRTRSSSHSRSSTRSSSPSRSSSRSSGSTSRRRGN
jgi:hypothetical protein